MRCAVCREKLSGCLSSARAGQRPSSGYNTKCRICRRCVRTTRSTSPRHSTGGDRTLGARPRVHGKRLRVRAVLGGTEVL
eukprot:514438-Prymnesium_polylepis.1